MSFKSAPTLIPTGQYICKRLSATESVINYTQNVWKLTGTPEHFDILIHSAKIDGKVEGYNSPCIILGETFSKLGKNWPVLNSGETFHKFMKITATDSSLNLTIDGSY